MSTSASITFTCQKLEPYNQPELARAVPVKIIASQTNLARGLVVGRVTASNLWKTYATGNVDGSGVAKGILMYPVSTDASGNHYLGDTANMEHGEKLSSVPIYISGTFRVADLTGLDADAMTDLGAKLIFGDDLNDANAVVYIP